MSLLIKTYWCFDSFNWKSLKKIRWFVDSTLIFHFKIRSFIFSTQSKRAILLSTKQQSIFALHKSWCNNELSRTNLKHFTNFAIVQTIFDCILRHKKNAHEISSLYSKKEFIEIKITKKKIVEKFMFVLFFSTFHHWFS